MHSIASLRILADDATGAADCAARCAGVGLPTTILLQMPTRPLPPGAVAFSSDSRAVAPVVAAARIRQLAGAIQQVDEHSVKPLWYKKIDSTLRGNIGAELAALLPFTTPPTASPCVIIAPAFPAQGRGLVNGYLVYAQAPAQALHLPTRLRQQTALPVATVALAEVRAGVAALAASLVTQQATGAQLIVVDALTEADLATLYQATRRALPAALFCGSAGLIGVIATALASPSADRPVAQPEQVAVSWPRLAVVGSGSPMAQRQVAHVLRWAQANCHEVNPQQPLDVPWARQGAPHPATLLHLPPPQPGLSLEGDQARHHAALLAQVAVAQIQQHAPQALIVVGGDTALHLLDALGITALQVVAELLPGMPLTIGETVTGARYQIILKAGNHGDAETLVTLLAWPSA
ncbi:MAG: four-carbon acid sugar kinase family protein [Caldilineaceae bacterium]|nr:four-carbon acid sugar kinase family protein [Caldilineaceae bacterium]